MTKRSLLITLFAVMPLVAAIAPMPFPAAAAWTSWSCGATVVNYPVSGGVLNGTGCAQWWDSGASLWQVDASTTAPYSYSILTYGEGDDSCDGSNWTYEMANQNTMYNTTDGESGVAEGSFLDCSPTDNHEYRVYGMHYSTANSGDPEEGSSGYAYF